MPTNVTPAPDALLPVIGRVRRTLQAQHHSPRWGRYVLGGVTSQGVSQLLGYHFPHPDHTGNAGSAGSGVDAGSYTLVPLSVDDTYALFDHLDHLEAIAALEAFANSDGTSDPDTDTVVAFALTLNDEADDTDGTGAGGVVCHDISGLDALLWAAPLGQEDALVSSARALVTTS